jgi:hypothetical protein
VCSCGLDQILSCRRKYEEVDIACIYIRDIENLPARIDCEIRALHAIGCDPPCANPGHGLNDAFARLESAARA